VTAGSRNQGDKDSFCLIGNITSLGVETRFSKEDYIGIRIVP
jgi:hypothetical protein